MINKEDFIILFVKLKHYLVNSLKNMLLKRGIKFSRSGFSSKSIEKLETFAVFKDSRGNSFSLLKGYRDLIKPGWQNMFKIKLDLPKDKKSVIENALKKIDLIKKYLSIYNFYFADVNVLEVGCGGGTDTFALSTLEIKHIDAIDIPDYGVRQNVEMDKKNFLHLRKQSEFLQEYRKSIAESYLDMGYSDIREKVTFFDKDIVKFDKQEIYNLIISWETLEHINNPKVALNNMFRALKPGGICFHEYNPFFAIDGGHSLCTLDFPYGHIRLSPKDFKSYIQKYRPKELKVALNFYHESLNRMTIAELMQYSKEVGFEVMDMHCFKCVDNLRVIDKIMFEQCKNIYPSVTLNDMVSRIIWVLLRKPVYTK